MRAVTANDVVEFWEPGHVSDMATYRQRYPRLFLKEHRESKGLSAEVMGAKLGIERESVYRLEREAATRCNPKKLFAYARALGVEPEDLWHPPGAPSLDGMLAASDDATRRLAADIISRILKKQDY